VSAEPLRHGGDLPRRRCRPRRIDPAGPRPSELLAAFFGAALTMLAAAGVAVIVSAATGDDRVDAGTLLIAAGLLLLGISLRAVQRRSLQRARWAVRWYQGSAACLAVGVLAGAAMAH
jgi:hypothetical protein